MNTDLMKRIIKYIEQAEYDIDNEWGDGRKLHEIIADGDMPDIYNDLLEELRSPTTRIK